MGLGMKTIRLIRTSTSVHGTEGILSCDNLLLYTLELPWRDNTPNISCIPAAKYQVAPRRSPKFGDTYHVQDVPQRTHILIHAGNFAGDTTQHLKSHVQGCILVGRQRGFIGHQRAVLSSRLAMNDFRDLMDKEPFQLEIIQTYSTEGN